MKTAIPTSQGGSSKTEDYPCAHPPFFAQHAVQARLRQGVSCIVKGASLHEDFMQEAMLHLWQTEAISLGKPACWYIRNSLFHVLELLRRGRSVDSLKRRHLGFQIGEYDGSARPGDAEFPRERDIVEQVCANDIWNELIQRLDSLNATILQRLVEGFGIREIARELGLSHPAVIKRRLQIAVAAVRVGFLPSKCFKLGLSKDRRASCRVCPARSECFPAQVASAPKAVITGQFQEKKAGAGRTTKNSFKI